MQNQLQKAINLSKKTGDRVIVVDSAGSDSAFVVMGLDEYEKLVLGKSEVRDLTEDELLDKINRDIAIWKSDNSDKGWIGVGDVLDDRYLSKNKPDFIKDYRVGAFEPKNEYFNNFKDDFEFDDEDYDEDDDRYYYEEDDMKDFYQLKQRESEKTRNAWEIPTDIKEQAEEVIEDESMIF
ncbi:hypothetical protein COV49_03625 [Candidatus Falkowbacteria bacterium CG11_big_fil_rev_8_21_14_0_20_39_10]|uniref:Uncharacterized protein n=1 Tax=Candidatus Falkowbacteria bacterium CG11_big_fil_rev_8_21_14_0_20_39_10 TaxID=1974570 RepID=A0A2M6K8F7_9BACT|nr:MAG: hypothetical protein COV49_03625 [Candidatus Falkowbacteria bacterium CG11_big_fil_rev_8_21_14_0_20_39_10]